MPSASSTAPDGPVVDATLEPGSVRTASTPLPRPGGRRSPAVRIARVLALAVGAALVLAFPALAPNPYVLSTGVIILSYATLATSWNFVGGFTGYISLGHAAYFGLGAYGTGLLITKAGVPSFAAIGLSALIVLLIAVPIGIASLRVRGASFVIVSIAFVLILQLVFQGWGSITGGSLGLTVPRPFPGLLRPEHHRVFFYLFAALLVLVLLTWWLIDRSRFGTRLKAVREDEDKAQSLGVPTRNYKLVAFVVSATSTALAGGLYALWFGDLDPIFQFSILLGAYIVLMALLGGARNVFGPVIGAVVVGVGLEFFKVNFGDTQFHLVAVAMLLGIVVLFMPDGVIPAAVALVRRFGPQAVSIRELSAAELAERERGVRVEAAARARPADHGASAADGYRDRPHEDPRTTGDQEER